MSGGRGQVAKFLRSVEPLPAPCETAPSVSMPAVFLPHDTSIELWTAYRRRRLLPGVSVSPWPWIVSIVAGFVLLLVLAGCASGPSAQDQADLVTVGAAIDAGCSAAALTPEQCTAAKEAAVRLGVSLEDVNRARLVAEAWDVARPIVTAGISILVGWLTQGGSA